MPAVTVKTEKPYEVKIETGLLGEAGRELLPFLAPGGRVFLLTDENTGRLFGGTVTRSLEKEKIPVTACSVPAGEGSKSLSVLETVLRALAAAHFTRDDLFVSLGGGMVSDLGGLAAALFGRGMGFAALPTTLLAALDASVGGKNAVNLPEGKNLAGTVRQPLLVLFDPDTLKTLSPRLISDGMAEAVKEAMLGAPGLMEEVMSPSPGWEHLAECAVAYKARLVERDPEDRGERRLLNLGHTVGHALEQASGYRLLHGEAVALGLMAVTRSEVKAGRCDPAALSKLRAALLRWNLPTEYEGRAEDLLPYLKNDKKHTGNTLVMVLPRSFGDCRLCPVGEDYLRELLAAGLPDEAGKKEAAP